MSEKPTGELYISVDVEADGTIPGDANMVSLGASVCGKTNPSGFVRLGGDGPGQCFYVELGTVFAGEQKTRDWLAEQGFEIDGDGAVHPEIAMKLFKGWVERVSREHGCRPVFVAYPLSFDWSFTHWYFEHFLGPRTDPFGFSNALDIKTAFSIKSGRALLASTKKNMPGAVKDVRARHTHNALDDAIGQGELFANLMSWEGSERT